MENRSWATEEMKLLCEILHDSVNNFMKTLKKKALKTSIRGVFEETSRVFQEACQDMF